MAISYYKKLALTAPSILSIVTLLLVIGGAITSLILKMTDLDFLDILQEKYIKHIIYFTFLQAVCSTILSVIFGVIIALALHRRRFFFARGILIKIISLSFILPAIVMITGLAVVHGKNGWINNIIHFYNNSSGYYYLYGFFGIILGHVTFFLPVVIRILLSRLDKIPNENWKVASLLNFSTLDTLCKIEIPFLLPSILNIIILIFIMSFTSFTIALNLGGGPLNTTLEVAIFQALKFDFDINRAVILSIIQMCICLLFMVFTNNILKSPIITQTTKQNDDRYFCDNKFVKIMDYFFIFLLVIIVILPLSAVLINGINDRFLNVIYSKEFWVSFKGSILIAVSSSMLALFLSGGIVYFGYYLYYHKKYKNIFNKIYLIANLPMILPPFIFTTGLFILLNSFVNVQSISIYIVILVNSIMALPFIISIIYQSAISFSNNEIMLCKNLNLTRWNFFRHIFWGRVKKSVGYAFALAIAISWGDLSVIALFGTNDIMTMPFLLYHHMSNYNFKDAEVMALILLLLSYFVFWLIEDIMGKEK
jgi:thiamine transport system permease protein